MEQYIIPALIIYIIAIFVGMIYYYISFKTNKLKNKIDKQSLLLIMVFIIAIMCFNVIFKTAFFEIQLDSINNSTQGIILQHQNNVYLDGTVFNGTIKIEHNKNVLENITYNQQFLYTIDVITIIIAILIAVEFNTIIKGKKHG